MKHNSSPFKWRHYEPGWGYMSSSWEFGRAGLDQDSALELIQVLGFIEGVNFVDANKGREIYEYLSSRKEQKEKEIATNSATV